MNDHQAEVLFTLLQEILTELQSIRQLLEKEADPFEGTNTV